MKTRQVVSVGLIVLIIAALALSASGKISWLWFWGSAAVCMLYIWTKKKE